MTERTYYWKLRFAQMTADNARKEIRANAEVQRALAKVEAADAAIRDLQLDWKRQKNDERWWRQKNDDYGGRDSSFSTASGK